MVIAWKELLVGGVLAAGGGAASIYSTTYQNKAAIERIEHRLDRMADRIIDIADRMPAKAHAAEDDNRPVAQLSVCRGDAYAVIATVTRIGDALVTATHFARDPACHWDGRPLIDRKTDISVLKAGDPGVCKDAQIGEGLVYMGFPATDPDGTPRRLATIHLEVDQGVLIGRNMHIDMLEDGKPSIPLEGLDRGSITKVRPGYSGGPVLSAVDGRVVGIINAGNGSSEVFQPISRVCEKIREAAGR